MSTRLVREMHAISLAGVRGRDRQPGEIRTTQNWIGPPGATIDTATFVPPLPEAITDLIPRCAHHRASPRRQQLSAA
ncbi:MAG: hypothetical protein JJU45_16155 [Acidimicrobiia bacterium]|nr:hypothetical protein [Acidimicrobiia bacterium]